MKLAICVDEKGENAEVSEVFGRCNFFAVYDTLAENLTFIENPGASQQRGAGIAAAQTLLDNKVEKVYCVNIGPNTQQAVTQGNIKIELVKNQTIKDILKDIQK
ncbi:NifB/NifX family molybdenum-iron cluster-binding protein [Candidatus Dojkabacteria bacterium]|nr:NifB/NifX family molybdenum-iron cluster-binding protein [Candidatus Dojkabacteria bacterium]